MEPCSEFPYHIQKGVAGSVDVVDEDEVAGVDVAWELKQAVGVVGLGVVAAVDGRVVEGIQSSYSGAVEHVVAGIAHTLPAAVVDDEALAEHTDSMASSMLQTKTFRFPCHCRWQSR